MTWNFEYYLHEQNATWRAKIDEGFGVRQRMTIDGGRMARFFTPTGSGISYEYERWLYPTLEGCSPLGHVPIEPDPEKPVPFAQTIGVRRRQLWSAERKDDGTVAAAVAVASGRTLYLDKANWGTRWQNWTLPRCGGVPSHQTTAIIDSLGKVDLVFYTYYFTGPVQPTEGNLPTEAASEFGMNWSRHKKIGSADCAGCTDDYYIAGETYSCKADEFSSDDIVVLYDKARQVAEGTLCNAPVRSRYVKLEMSTPTEACPWYEGPNCVHFNQRTKAEKIVYNRDLGAEGRPVEKTTVNDGFDGLGHYRIMEQKDTFNAATFPSQSRSDDLKRETNYNNGIPGLCGGGTCSLTNNPTALETWLLTRYDRIDTTTSDGLVARTMFTFDDRGFLTARRVRHYPNANNPTDILTLFQRTTPSVTGEPAGSTVRIVEQWAGGDEHPLGSTFQAEYRIARTFQYGALKRVAYLNPTAALNDTTEEVLLIENNEVARASGLITRSADAANVGTRYQYDAAGRLTSASDDTLAGVPFREATTNYKYEFLAPAGARVTVERPDQNGERTLYTFDGWGRIAAVDRRMPDQSDDAYTRTTKEYDARGNVTAESTPFGVATPTSPDPAGKRKTQYSGFDVFGRAGRIQQPDGAVVSSFYVNTPTLCTDPTDSCFTAGDRVRQKSAQVLTTAGVQNARVTESRDRNDRLVRISEDIGSSDYVTDYTYDDHGNLIEVEQRGTTASGGDITQRRRFRYDGRGFLYEEKFPEKGNSSSDHVQYRYDSRGNVTQRTTSGLNEAGAPKFVTLLYAYDSAERLTDVFKSDSAQATIVPFKKYEYYDTNTLCTSSAGGALGKLKAATRHNYVPTKNDTQLNEDVVVTELYRYNAPMGKLSQIDISTKRPAVSTDGNSTSGVVDGPGFVTMFRYDELGNLKDVVYPGCVSQCTGVDPVRTVTNSHSRGFVTAIPDFVSKIKYHPNGLYQRIERTNTVNALPLFIDEQTVDNGMARPASIQANGLGDKRDYAFDGSGNVTQAGADRFYYDRLSRLVKSNVNATQHTYDYDRWGNLTSIAGTALGVHAPTNRLTGSPVDVAYDSSGNLTKWDAWGYRYDAANMMAFIENTRAGGIPHNRAQRVAIYNADDERLATFDYAWMVNGTPTTRELWTVRGIDKKVLRDYENVGGSWSWSKDYVYRAGALVASTSPGALTHYHLDHLGSIRWTASPTGTGSNARMSLKQQILYPFGSEFIAASTSDRLKFTGHERDDVNTSLELGDLDYMHARYYNPAVGRFLSVDPGSTDKSLTQQWNRYAYVRNNPVTASDPDGREENKHRTDQQKPPNNPRAEAPLKKGTASVGFTGSFSGAGLNVSAAVDLNFDRNDDLSASITLGGGAGSGVGGSLVTSLMLTDGRGVDDLNGWFMARGGSAGDGYAGGAEYLSGTGSDGKAIHGVNVSAGLGAGVEIHATPTYTLSFKHRFIAVVLSSFGLPVRGIPK